MFRKISVLPCVALGLIVLAAFFGADPVNAQILTSFGEYTYAGNRLTGAESRIFPQNNLTFWNPYECDPKGGSGPGPGVRSDSCFKINSSVGAQDFWYAEGCIDNGTCTAGIYFEGSEETLTLVINNKSVLWDSGKGRFRDDVIKTDDDFGGLQYIYAENYDFEYGGSETKLTPNGGSSTRKYYWVALPDEAYTKGFGDTYVATFENLSEPVYFITFDAHACGDQSEGYCDKALADPDGVEIGGEFLGALSKNGGSPTEAANKAGKLTSFCRINGTGEVLVTSNGSASSITTSGSSDSSSDTSVSSSDGSGTTSDASSGKTVAEKIYNWFVRANISGVSDNPAVIAGIIGSFATEAGGNTIEGLTPFSWSSWGGTLLGCIPEHCGNIKNKVTEAVGKDYFAYKTGVDGIPEEAVDKAIDLELKFIINDYNSGINWKTFVENLDVVSNKTPESYAELFAVIVENAAGSIPAEDPGLLAWIDDHPEYSASQQVLDLRRKLAREAYEKLADGDCPLFDGDYPDYNQSTGPWSGDDYGGCTIGGCGCGPSSMAMLATVAAGQDIFPNDVADLTKSTNYYWGALIGDTTNNEVVNLDKIVGEKYGFEVVEVSVNETDKSDVIAKMNQYLDDGYMLHFSGEGDCPYPSAHFVGIFGKTGEGDNVRLANSAFKGQCSEVMSLSDVVNNGYHGGAFSAIKGGSRACASKGNDDNICPDEFGDDDSDGDSGGGTVTAGGLDDDAAKALAAYYKSGGGTQCGGAQRESCYAFSMWFLCNFTSVVSEGTNACSGVATGGEVVGCLKDRYGISTGNEPKPFAIFSVPNHTGVVVRVNDDGSYVTVEAAENDGVSYTGWADTPGDGWARVFTHDSSYGASFAYVGDKVDMDKLNSVVGR